MHIRVSKTALLRMAWTRDVAKPARIFGRAARALFLLALLGHAALILFILFASLALRWWSPASTALMAYRRVTVHQKIQPVRFTPLRQIPRVFRTMITRLEDYHFYEHGGVDLGALRDAWQTNLAIGRTAVGGSTIPMQLARNLFLTPRKTYFRKYLEAVIAVEMDLLLPKDRILELYLNSIEWGKGVFGIGAAARSYYGTSVANLTLDQLRRLATIITNPLRYGVDSFPASRQMAERYAYLVERFPDPTSEPAEPGPERTPEPDAQPPAAPQLPAETQPLPDAQPQAAPAPVPGP
jgi:monofunctional biosynthetic peptidoglycan transglycosylase